MVNIKDVAEYANLSVATVSRYLNKNGYISEKSKNKIEQAIIALNYKPNHIARSLSKKQSKLIGLIVPDIQNPFFPQLARAIEDTALQYDYTIVLCNTDGTIEKEKLYIERLAQNYVAGLLVATNLNESDFYQSIKIPVVALDRQNDNLLPSVMSDNFGGAKKGTEHLIACGATNLLCIRGPMGVKTADERERGFYAALKNTNVRGKTIEAGFEFEEATTIISKNLKQDLTIDGIFASSDLVAVAAVKTLHNMNKHVPQDIQIVGFDGIKLGTMISPELTTVCQDIDKLGKDATTMLIELIEGRQLNETNIVVETKLITRGTTRKERCK